MTRSLLDIAARLRALPKMRLFLLFLALAAAVGAVGSFITWMTLYRAPAAPPLRVIVAAPASGPNSAVARALFDGAALYARERAGHSALRPVEIVAASDDSEALRKAAEDPNVAAIIGLDAGATDPALAASKLPRINLSGAAPGAWSLALSADRHYEARFLANYERNVIGEKLVSILLPEGADWAGVADSFDETLKRFSTRVVYRWALPAEGGKPALDAATREIVEKQIAGDILVLGPPDFAARAIAALGAAKIPNRIVGLRDLATQDFAEAIEREWTGPGSLSAMLNSVVFTTPALFDVEGVGAQTFQNNFRAAFHRAPDWSALLGYDAANMIAAAADAAQGGARLSGAELRPALRAGLLGFSNPDNAFDGLSGPLFFGSRSGGALPTLIGRYEGRSIVAAETQLSPIRDEGVTNYLEQLTAGKALYVNDRFMYKTNVVSAGISIAKILEPNLDANIAEVEFMLWFRWRGNLSANDVVFENAAEPIMLGNPTRSHDEGDLHYRAWRVRGKFFLNVAPVARPFGSQMVTIAIRHRTLARNNLMYVADVVGMDLAAAPQTASQQESFIGRLLGVARDGDSALLRQLQNAKVLAGAPNYIVDKAVIAQDVARAGTDSEGYFSGVMLNLERPFVLNDWVRINKTIAQVSDISWRTTRLRTSSGQVIAMANGKVVEAEIENLTRAGFYETPCKLYMDPRVRPDEVIAAIKAAVAAVAPDFAFTVNRVALMRIENVNGQWAARYVAEFRIPDYLKRSALMAAFWPVLWQELAKSGLTWATSPNMAEEDAEVLRARLAPA